MTSASAGWWDSLFRGLLVLSPCACKPSKWWFYLWGTLSSFPLHVFATDKSNIVCEKMPENQENERHTINFIQNRPFLLARYTPPTGSTALLLVSKCSYRSHHSFPINSFDLGPRMSQWQQFSQTMCWGQLSGENRGPKIFGWRSLPFCAKPVQKSLHICTPSQVVQLHIQSHYTPRLLSYLCIVVIERCTYRKFWKYGHRISTGPVHAPRHWGYSYETTTKRCFTSSAFVIM